MTHPESLRRSAKRLRARGKTQRQIAEAVGVSQYTIWSWLHGGAAAREHQRQKNARYSWNLVSDSLYLGIVEHDPVDERKAHVELICVVNLRTRRRIGFQWNFHHNEEGDRQSAHSLAFREWDGSDLVFSDETHRARYLSMFRDGVLIGEVTDA